ncbi:MAG: hypothetical protein H7839_11620 [Magnetococcus sp. YQC-5]
MTDQANLEAASPPSPVSNTKTFGYFVEADRTAYEINFQILDSNKITSDMDSLREDVESTVGSLHTIFKNTSDKKFQAYFDRLLALAQVGLMGENPLPLKAQRALDSLKKEINTQEAPVIRMNYLKKLGLHAIVQSLVCVVIVWVIGFFSLHKGYFEGKEIMNCGVMWIGCMAGVWLSVSMSPASSNLDSLQLIARDASEPSIRLIFTGLLTIFIALLLKAGVVEIKLGGLQTATFLTDFKISLLLGMFCGLGEKALSTTVSQRVDQFIGELNKKSET